MLNRLGTCSNAELFTTAFVSRVALLLLALSMDGQVEDYDTGSFFYPNGTIGAVSHWDAVHFAHIATNGYTHENIRAFSPGLPFIMRHIGPTPALFLGYLCFAGSAVLLRMISRLSCRPLSDRAELMSDRAAGGAVAALLFSPATPFTVVAYTENPFMFLSFLGIWLVLRGWEYPAAIIFTVAAVFRANGMLLAAFFGYQLMFGQSIDGTGRRISRSIIPRVVYSLCIAAPFFYTNFLAHNEFCVGLDGNLVEGCPSQWWGFFDYIQKKYWKVSWFGYWTPNNIPNFAIAAPLYIVTARFIYSSPKKSCLFDGWLRSPQLVYLVALLALAAGKMNVQVVNRFVLACPAVHWMVGCVLCEGKESWARFLMLRYCVAFTAIGLVMFTNFYNWT